MTAFVIECMDWISRMLFTTELVFKSLPRILKRKKKKKKKKKDSNFLIYFVE